MKITLRPAMDRGFFDFGWLQTYHSFSFGDYHDPQHMGFRRLRVMNQDTVQPGHGFDTHPHRDMEIITYVLQGTVTHKDTMGNETIIHAGEIQCMSAGSGVQHSEYNRAAEILKFLQIWILPDKIGVTPSYQQKTYDPSCVGFQLLAAPEGGGGLVSIHQDVQLFRGRSDTAGTPLAYTVAADRGVWVQLISGEAAISGALLKAGDGASMLGPGKIEISPESLIELLLFDT
jgi:redox-sensitive bicupin YhaK (pirin superfamily)